jgi:hypothetical protein
MLTPETRKEGKHLLKGSNRLSRCLEWTSKLSLKSGITCKGRLLAFSDSRSEQRAMCQRL